MKIHSPARPAVGYFAGRLSATKLPIVGAGFGLGVLHDTGEQTRNYGRREQRP